MVAPRIRVQTLGFDVEPVRFYSEDGEIPRVGIRVLAGYIRGPAAPKVWAIPELQAMIWAAIDLIGLGRLRMTDSLNARRGKLELARRYSQLIRELVPEEHVRETTERIATAECTFGGWRVLKVIQPSCEDLYRPTRNIYTLYTPLVQYDSIVAYFRQIGFRRTRVLGTTLELDRGSYGDAIYGCINLRSPHNGTLIDIVGSANAASCYPMFRVPTTRLMHCMNGESIFAPYANLTCNSRALTNNVHGTGRFGLVFPVQMEMAMDMLRDLYRIDVRHNAGAFTVHRGGCALHPDCIHTTRTTAEGDSGFFQYSGTGSPFFHDTGILWRLGGWACYPGHVHTFPILTVVPNLHRRFRDELVADLMRLPADNAFRELVGY